MLPLFLLPLLFGAGGAGIGAGISALTGGKPATGAAIGAGLGAGASLIPGAGPAAAGLLGMGGEGAGAAGTSAMMGPGVGASLMPPTQATGAVSGLNLGTLLAEGGGNAPTAMQGVGPMASMANSARGVGLGPTTMQALAQSNPAMQNPVTTPPTVGSTMSPLKKALLLSLLNKGVGDIMYPNQQRRGMY